MNTNAKIHGIHHITAIASSAEENLDFYETVLGLRFVKKTVNFDDPYTYHLYYGDSKGSPGTIITFFPWQKVPRGRIGAGMVAAITFSIPADAVGYWRKRLNDYGIETKETERFGDRTIQFEDPHGLALELIENPTARPTAIWKGSRVPPDRCITGIHSATEWLHSLEETRLLLTDVMGMSFKDKEGNRHRFEMKNDDGSGCFYDAVIDSRAQNARQGGGTVHHIAFRTSTDDEQKYWRNLLVENRFSVTPIIDRKYFKSIYFHEPGGVLFEIATDPPGFTVDEPYERLGRALKLPAQLEVMRTEIENRLPKLTSTGFVHEFIRPRHQQDDGRTIVALHGTGGNERDLIEVAKRMSATSAILSPLGKVLESGRHRFFKRLANGVFDEQDVMERAHELADFLIESASRYERPPENLIGMGYSNGANIGVAVMFLRPEVFSSAILFRPMLPLQNPRETDLSGKEILVLRGKYDNAIPAKSTDRLIAVLEKFHAAVNTLEVEAGHELTADDVALASKWLSNVVKQAAVEVIG
jgi:predicted esterase/catechol 2,3-dioxygenase-like lactoylglutathione lyase family enzyme